MRKKFFEIFEVEAAKHCPNLTSKTMHSAF